MSARFRWRLLPVLAASVAMLIVQTAAAQTGADANRWAAWCRQRGTVDNSSGTLICIPHDSGGGASGGYSADQQAMLNLAGQFGSALGAAIRQSFQRSERQQQIIEMQQAWEREQARERAAADLERQRQRNETLLANMRGTIGASELGRTGIGQERLRLRTTDEMFNTPGNARGEVTQAVPVSALIDLERMQAAQTAYFDAMDDLNDADQAVLEKQSRIQVVQDIMTYLNLQLEQQEARLALLPGDSAERPAAEAELARLQASAAQVRGWQAEDAEELTQLRAEADAARAAFRAAQARSGASTAASEANARR